MLWQRWAPGRAQSLRAAGAVGRRVRPVRPSADRNSPGGRPAGGGRPGRFRGADAGAGPCLPTAGWWPPWLPTGCARRHRFMTSRRERRRRRSQSCWGCPPGCSTTTASGGPWMRSPLGLRICGDLCRRVLHRGSRGGEPLWVLWTKNCSSMRSSWQRRCNPTTRERREPLPSERSCSPSVSFLFSRG